MARPATAYGWLFATAPLTSNSSAIAPPANSSFPMALSHGASASSVLPATSQLPRRPGQHLPDGAPPRRTASSASATVPRPAAPPPRRLGRCSQRSCRQLLPDAAALSSMQGPPRSGNFSAQTSASLHPSRSASLAGTLPFTMDMGVHGLCGRVPDSAGSICPPDEAAA